MATAFGRPGITPGTGTGSVGDPLSFTDIISPGNTAGLSNNDIVALMSNGVTFDTPTVALVAPSLQDMIVLPVDFSGNLTTNRWMVDAASAGAGYGLDFSGFIYAKIYMPHVKDAPTSGIYLNSGNVLFGAKLIDSGDNGVLLGTSARNVFLDSLWIEGSGAMGIRDNETVDTSTIQRCYIQQLALNGDGIKSAGKISQCVVVFDLTGATNVLTKKGLSSTGTIYSASIRNCTVIMAGDKSSLTNAVYALSFGSGSTFQLPDVQDNLVLDLTTGSTAQIMGAYNSVTAQNFFFRGNKYFGAGLTPTINFPVGVSIEPPEEEDPDLVNAAGGDFRPQNDITLNVLTQRIAAESPAWIGSGALSHLLDTGGGGGGGFIPRGILTGGRL